MWPPLYPQIVQGNNTTSNQVKSLTAVLDWSDEDMKKFVCENSSREYCNFQLGKVTHGDITLKWRGHENFTSSNNSREYYNIQLGIITNSDIGLKW